MKVIVWIAFVFFALNATAQLRGGPEDFARKRVENMKQAVTLSVQQEKEIIALFVETLAQRDETFAARRESGETREAVGAKLQKLRDEETAKLKKILNPEQFKAYTAYLEKQREEATRRGQEQERKK